MADRHFYIGSCQWLFWGMAAWVSANTASKIVDGFDDAFLKEGCYRLSIGEELILSTSQIERNKKGAYRKLKFGDIFYLHPGQFAYLITSEKVYIPENAIGFINVSTESKFEGLTNISGFHVDPRYNGRLIFTVFNAGPSVISMSCGGRIFRLWLSDFQGHSEMPKAGWESILKKWAGKLQGVYPSPFALAEGVSNLETRIEKLTSQRFQALLFGGFLHLFLFPFVAALTATVISPPFSDVFSERFKQMKELMHKPSAAPATPSTDTKPERLAPQQ